VPWLALLGVVLIVVGLAGAIVWIGALSPYGFIRFPLNRADRTVTVSRSGTYLIFEEFDGATRSDLPPPLEIAVNDVRGRSLPVVPTLDPGERGAPFSYNVPPNEGRAIARFVAPSAGRYRLQVQPFQPEAADRSSYREELPGGLAVGRQLSVTWLRTPLGLVLLGVVPVAAGTVVLVVAVRRRHRRTRDVTIGGAHAVR
jgi:hypothetical protein